MDHALLFAAVALTALGGCRPHPTALPQEAVPCEVKLSGAVEQTFACGIQAARVRGHSTFILNAQIGPDAKKLPMLAITMEVSGGLRPSTTYNPDGAKSMFGVVLGAGSVKYLAQPDKRVGHVQVRIDDLGAQREGILLLYDVHGTAHATFYRADGEPGTVELTATF